MICSCCITIANITVVYRSLSFASITGSYDGVLLEPLCQVALGHLTDEVIDSYCSYALNVYRYKQTDRSTYTRTVDNVTIFR